MVLPKLVFSDFDGTLTQGLRLGPEFWQIIELLKQNQIPLVIVSGRSISWGHFLLTHFPIKAVIMEQGGCIATANSKGVITQKVMASQNELLKLSTVEAKLKHDYGESIITQDSLGRIADRAIELEELQGRTEIVDKIKKYLISEAMTYSTSSVHINFWCGNFNKASSSLEYLKQFHPHLNSDNCCFFGDAPNDESMFQTFSHSIGVSNLKKYTEKMEYLPRFQLEGKENEGAQGVLNYLRSLK